jgi:RNA polymerase sigma-70 factor (ECF subfamily)
MVFRKVEEKATSSVTPADRRISERKLIEAVQNGDKQAFGGLVRMHQKRLFRFIYGLTGSFDVTEDIVQDAFVKAFAAMDRFRPEQEFYPWLSTIARNLAFNHIHREEKKESLDRIAEQGFDRATPDLGPLDQLLDTEGQERFYEALQSLPPTYRTVFVLRHFEDMDYSQIASYLKIPPGTVDSRLYRARKMMLEALQDLLDQARR